MFQNNLASCLGLQERLESFQPFANPYLGKCFYEGENFRLALQRLDGGYLMSQDLIQMMENVRDLYNQLCNGYNEFCITSSGRIRYQSTLSSYHTTKRAQLNIVTSIQKLISVEQQRIQNIQTVIDNYKKSIDEMYVTTRFTHQRQHYRTKDIKRQFKEAQSSLNDCTKRLGQLREARTKARESLEQVDCALEI
ncbi:unnamed protein product, partial [Didymodactylos carnosus]